MFYSFRGSVWCFYLKINNNNYIFMFVGDEENLEMCFMFLGW